MPKKGFLKSLLTAKTISVASSVVIAIAGAFTGWQVLLYRVDQLEKDKCSKGEMQVLLQEIKDFKRSQHQVNDIMLNFLATRGYTANRVINPEIKTETKDNIDKYYGSQAYKILKKR